MIVYYLTSLITGIFGILYPLRTDFPKEINKDYNSKADHTAPATAEFVLIRRNENKNTFK